MTKLPITVQSKFHSFCERCPLCSIEGEENEVYAFNEVYERESIVTCEHYDFCERMAKAVNDGLVDMKKKPKVCVQCGHRRITQASARRN